MIFLENILLSKSKQVTLSPKIDQGHNLPDRISFPLEPVFEEIGQCSTTLLKLISVRNFVNRSLEEH